MRIFLFHYRNDTKRMISVKHPNYLNYGHSEGEDVSMLKKKRFLLLMSLAIMIILTGVALAVGFGLGVLNSSGRLFERKDLCTLENCSTVHHFSNVHSIYIYWFSFKIIIPQHWFVSAIHLDQQTNPVIKSMANVFAKLAMKEWNVTNVHQD